MIVFLHLKMKINEMIEIHNRIKDLHNIVELKQLYPFKC